jgi:hypothetical protein
VKFYTPEMVNLWNSANPLDEQAHDKFNQEWEDAQDACERHTLDIAEKFPLSVRKFFDCVLHNEAVISLPRALDYDGRVVGYAPGDGYTVVTASGLDGLLHVLTYNLELAPRVVYHEGIGFDPADNAAVWLYDEFHLDDAGRFQHNVLFSNGMELIVTFKCMHWHECVMQEEG